MKTPSQTTRELDLLSHAFNGLPRILALALFGLICYACPLPNLSAEPAISVEQVSQRMRDGFRQQQWNRLTKADDRDSLIAAVLLGMPDATDHVALGGNSEVKDRLARRFGQDPEVMFVLALACQKQAEACGGSFYERLIKAEPGNAVNWLLLPNQVGPNIDQLKSAAASHYADTHLRMVVRILNSALAGQPTGHAAEDGDFSVARASALRVNAIERVPLPTFAGVMSVCRPSAQESRVDCVGLGRLLSADRDGTILTKMIGSAIVRRFLKGSDEAKVAFEMRREYVWLSEQLEGSDESWKEQVQSDLENMGEWVAVQRAVERLGKSSTPAADWVPQNPQALLLSEERKPASSK